MKRHLTLLALGATAWWGAFQLRAWIRPYCAKSVELCQAPLVPAWDRWSIGWSDPRADWLSFLTQDLAGALAVLIPFAYVLWRGLPRPRLLQDWALLLQATCWNGALKETTHALTQRARPFVYGNPLTEGVDVAHYTSFYSGHTSFAAVASMSLYLALRRHGASPALLRAATVLGIALTTITGLARILAGRHFLTDVVVAAFVGAAVARALTYRLDKA
jgi:membrane-associated phospholipid phosphatase